MVAVGRTLQRDHFIRDSHGGAEFLDLAMSPSHQCHAADAGRKAEIVLDPRRCASLAAEGAASRTRTDRPSDAA